MSKNNNKNFAEVEEKILSDREYILGLLKKVIINDNSDFSIVGGTIAKLSEILARQNEQLLNLLKTRMAIKNNSNGDSVDEDLKDLANSIPVQFDQKMPS
jgi:hypothetical protein